MGCIAKNPWQISSQHCISIILSIVWILVLVGPQLVIHISGQWVSDTQLWNLGFEALLVNECLFLRIICCPSIICCGAAPQIRSWVVFPQYFTVWVHHGLCGWWVVLDDIVGFSRWMSFIYGCENLNFLFESKCGYSILQFLVKPVHLKLVRSYLSFSGNPKIALW